MNIGEVVRLIGLSEHTLRYYEKVGLLPPIRRDAGGNRLFTPEDLRWLEFLVKLRQTRMPLRQMLRYAAWSVRATPPWRSAAPCWKPMSDRFAPPSSR